MKKYLRIISFLALLLFIAGCENSCKTLVEAPNPNLDPVPLDGSEVNTKGLDLLQKDQWHVQKLELEKVWQASSGRQVKVAVLGTGVDYNHEDLRNNIAINAKELSNAKPGEKYVPDGVDNDQNGYVDDIVGYDFVELDGFAFDRSGAGTAAAGVIGAVHSNAKGIKGINPDVSIIPVRYIGINGQAIVPHLINALKYTLVSQPDVIYLHLAHLIFTDHELIAAVEVAALKKVLQEIAQKDIPLVINAGNNGSNIDQMKDEVIGQFTQFENVIAVTSVDQNDRRPYIANFGLQSVKTSAPGMNILTTKPGNQYGYENGTYMSAAIVAGEISLAKSYYFGKFTTSQLVQTLLDREASDVVPDLELQIMGGNRTNVAKFMGALSLKVK